MQETLVEQKANDGPKSTIDTLEKASVTKHDTQQHADKGSSVKSTNTTREGGDGSQLDESELPEPGAMVDSSVQDVKISDKKEKKDKEKVQKDINDSDNNKVDLDAAEGSSGERTMPEAMEAKDTDKNGDYEMKANSESGLVASQHDNTSDKEKSGSEKKNGKLPPSTTPTPAAGTAAAPGPPIMRGTLSLDLNGQRHLIRGMWNYENSNAFPAQRFELVRNLDPDEDKKKLPVDGVFHGSFSLAYLHMTSKGKQKERSKVVQETGVEIKFTPVPDKEGEYVVDGKGTNQFGVFLINGTATPSDIKDDPTLSIVLKKRYETVEPSAAAPSESAPIDSTFNKSGKSKKSASTSGVTAVPSASTLGGSDDNNNAGPLPEPTKSFASGVLALRGTLYKEESTELGLVEIVHRINGMWAAGLDHILADPQNVQGFCNRFEYEHKSSSTSNQFPVSGRYSGWFEISNEDATRTRINERDVTLKFRLNSAGYHNIEGKGSNVFGKYSITGTLTLDNVITIFRVFQPRKIKTKIAPAISEAGETGATTLEPARRPSVGQLVEPKLKLDDVEVSIIDPSDESGGEPYDPISPPANGTYSAVSQGVLRLNEDGSHSCQGKWAVTREHFTNSLTSNFNFRLETHHAQDAMGATTSNGEPRQFPLDSAMYKGSFQMKKGGSRYQTVVDDQIVMKFRKNKNGSFNVYGTGINAIGQFNLLGTLVMSGKAGGQVELYRMYKPTLDQVPSENVTSIDDSSGAIAAAPGKTDTSWSMAPLAVSSSATTSILPGPPERMGLLRRESSRMSKLPSRLEEDDPNAQLSRIMEKCGQVLKFIREKDVELGAFFCEPVDPVELGIPTYHKVIKEPMDLRTVQRKMDSDDISTPEEFIRLVRLVFENAIKFNIDPAHSVHQAARSLLVKFNEKIRDVERLVQSIRRSHGVDEDGKGKKKKKEEKKRKRYADEPKSLKRQRLDEVEEMVFAHANAVAAIVAAAPPNSNATVTRVEFNHLLNLMQQLHGQIVQTHSALADLSPDTVEGYAGVTSDTQLVAPPSMVPKASNAPGMRSSPATVPVQEKKATKRKMEPTKPSEPVVTEDDASPLTHEEQEWLTDTISELPQEHLVGVIQIIREAAPVGAEEEEIDIEIDQLDHRTQRKLMRHVMKFVKRSKPKPKKKSKPQAQPPKKSAEKPPPAKKPKPASKPKPAATTESFFSFGGGKDDSDSDSSSSDDDDEKSNTAPNNDAVNEFKLSAAMGDLHNDEDDDLGSDGIAGVWMELSNPTNQSDKKEDDEDLDWAAAAREQAKANKARDADRKAREEKMKKEAEEANKKAMAEAAKRKEELLAKKAEEKEKEALLIEQQEKEAEKARELAREQARLEAQSVEQTVDLEGQRILMEQFDHSYLDNDSTGGASPSSDFGF